MILFRNGETFYRIIQQLDGCGSTRGGKENDRQSIAGVTRSRARISKIATRRSERRESRGCSMLPFVGLALLYIVLLAIPATAGIAFYLSAALLIAYCGMSNTVDRPIQTLIAGAVTLMMAVSNFVGPVNRVLVSMLRGESITSETYDPATRAAARNQPDTSIGSLVRIPISADRHFRVRSKVSGISIPMLVDTGASTVVLTYDDALRIVGPKLNEMDFRIPVQTANGTALAAQFVAAEIRIGDIAIKGIIVMIAQPGALGTSLLGMNFLDKLTRFSVERGELVLYQEHQNS